MKTQIMQRFRTWLWSALLLALTQPVSAGIVPDGALHSVLPKSDVVCVGTVRSVGEAGHSLFKVGTGLSVEAQVAGAEISVEAVLSGNFSGTRLHLLYPAPLSSPRMSSNYTPYPHVVVGERAVFFLVKPPISNDKAPEDKEARSFLLYSPFALPSPIIPIGNVSLTGVLAAATPLRRVILTLVRALDVPDNTIRLDCLQRLGGVGYLLDVKPGVYLDEYAVKDRLTLGESVSTPQSTATDLESFVKSRVLLAVLGLATNSDAEVREQATFALGRLQDVDVIPALAKIADKQYKPGETGEAAFILRFYRNPAATRPLVGVLGDTNPNVRSQAAAALRELADPVAVPSLLEHLDDPDPDARYFIATALYTATNTPEHPDMALFQAKEDQYVTFWKKWALDHQDKVAALREQFLAPLPPKAVH